MPQFVLEWTASLRRRLAWSNSREAWTERAAGAALLAVVILLVWLGGSLAPSRRVLLWGLLLLAVAGLLRRGWVQLFGPVLFYELLRIGRRGRYIAVRCLYAFALLAFLLCVYGVWLDTVLIVRGTMATRDLAQFAASFFYVFACLQIGMVILLTPAYTARVLAEEKERGTLEALLATDLRNREIVLGLFLARLFNLTLLLLAGLPILSFLQFMGGVDPNLVVSSFVGAGCTMVSLASISFLCSLYARRSRDAIVRSYLLILGYIGLSGLSWVLLLPQLQLAAFPSSEEWLSPITLEDVVHWCNYGNIVSVGFQLAFGVMRGGKLDDLLWDAVTKYAWFHGLIAAGCCAWAVLQLRAKALEQLTNDSKERGGLSRVGRALLPLHDWPMLWKEIAVGAGDRRGLMGLFINGCLLAVLAVPVLHIVYYYGRAVAAEPSSRLTDLINLWVRGASVLLGCILLLQVAVRAAGSMSGERGRHTLDGLLATALDNREILAGKWLGSIFGPRRSWLGMAVVWTIGLATGALHPLAPLCFVLAWLVYAAFLAALGLWASVSNRSTHRATFWTLFLVGAVLVASWLAAFDVAERWLTEPEALSLSPPLALGLLTFSPADVNSWRDLKSQWSFRGIVLGLIGWSAAAAGLWAMAKIRFRVVTGREAVLVGRAMDGSPLPLASPDAYGQPAVLCPTPAPPAIFTPTPSPDGSRSSARATTREGLREGVRVGARESPTSRRYPVRDLLRLGTRTTLVLLPLGLLIGEYARLDRAADVSLREALAETDRLDPGWRLDDLEAKRQDVSPEENSALQIVKAKNLISANWWKDEHELVFEKLTPERQLSAKQLEVLRKSLKQVEAALFQARRLADMPHGRFAMVVREDSPWHSRYPGTQDARSVVSLLGHDVDLRVQEDDADGALESCRALLNAGRAVGDEPTFISQMVRAALQREAVLKMERVLAQGEPTQTALQVLQRLLAKEDQHPMALIALRGDRAWADLIMQSLAKGTNMSGSYFVVQRGTAAVPLLPRDPELRMIGSGSLKGQRAAVLRVYNDLVEAAKLSPEQAEVRLQKAMTALRSSNPPAAIREFLNPGLVQRTQQHALLRSAVVALAAERYRHQHSRWPDTLDALVPAFLPRVPLDPHDGMPLRYRRLPKGVVIYSVGPDAVDNGGNLDRHGRIAGGVDVGAQLWDPNSRRQPPAPETTN
jgi:ABC-type transport system involved in multi-copper enzyme maturation permease subunit